MKAAPPEETTDLGALVETHEYTTLPEQQWIVSAVAACALGLALAWSRRPFFFVLPLAGVGLLLFAAQSYVRGRRHHGSRIHRHDHGLRVELRGHEPVEVRWAELRVEARRSPWAQHVRRNLREVEDPTNGWRYRVLGGGLDLVVDGHWTGVRLLVAVLRRILEVERSDRVRVRLVEIRRTLERDGHVAFGPLTISRRSVGIDGREIAWSEVRDVRIEQGQVVVLRTTGGRFGHVVAAKVPDVELVPELAREVRDARTTYR